jgi:hypothetical protein
MAREQLQQAHDQRSGQTQKRRGEGRAHAAQLILQPVHQPPEDREPLFPLGGLERADRLDHRRDRGGEPEERAQKPEENQKVRDVSRDVAAFFHPRADRIEHRFGRGRRHLHPPAAHPADRRRRRQQARGPVHRVPPPPDPTASIHATEENSWNTCQKQASTPTTKTMPIVPLR